MKVTLKDFLIEQKKLGKKVPTIFEDMSIGPNGQFNDDSAEDADDFELWDDTDISGPSMQMSITNLIDETISLIKKEVTAKYGQPNPEMEKKMAQQIASLWTNTINENLVTLTSFNNSEQLEEGFFNDLKNKFTGTIEYNTANGYAGSQEAQDFIAKDRRSKVQIETLVKRGMTPEEAKAAVMYVFDKNGKNPLGFVGKSTEYDQQTKTLKVSSVGGMNPSLGSL